MKLICFLLLHRGGSNLWGFLNGRKIVQFFASPIHKRLRNASELINPNAINPEIKEWKGQRVPFFLPTIPEETCVGAYCIPTQKQINLLLNSNLPTKTFATHVNVGNWWGEVPGHKVPGPYPSRYSQESLQALPVEEKMFIHLVRDGRNQAESFINVPGGIEGERYKKDKIDYFTFLCKGFRNRARVMIDNNNNMENFKIFKFEDFIKDPVKVSSDMYEFAGLKADTDFMERAYKLTKEKNTVKQHSSFKSKKNMNKRYKDWDDWKKDLFKEIAGQELIELGYEKDNNW